MNQAYKKRIRFKLTNNKKLKTQIFSLPGTTFVRRRFSCLPWRKMSLRNSKCCSFCSSSCEGQKSAKEIRRPKSRLPPTDISIPGMNNVLTENHSFARRLFWTTAIFLCTVACLVLVAFRIHEFLKIPVTVQVDVVQETVISFPAVTICPFYPFSFNRRINELRDEYAAHHNISHSVITYWNDSNSIHFLDLLELPEINITNLWYMGGMEEIHMEINRACQFETKKNCHVPINVKKLVTYLGICITLTFKANELFFDGSYNGMELKIFDHGSDSSYWQHMYRRVNTRHRPCKNTAEIELCRKDCIEYHLTKNVTCRLPYMESENLSLCSSPNTAKHTYQTTLGVYSQLEDLCSHCQRECVKTYYNMIQDVVMAKNCTWPKILMQDNTVELVQETTPYTFGVLLSEIGGSLGLFLGACILTGLQVLEAFTVHIVAKVKSNKIS